MKKTGIYKITNIINNKSYVGSSINIYRRWNQHRKLLICNKHYNKRLQNSVNKHGIKNFIFSIIEECEPIDLISKEQYHIDELNSYTCGYNGRPIASSPLGTKLSEERKKVISVFHKNRKRGPCSEETKKKLSDANKGKTSSRKGVKLSEDVKRKISKSKKGQPSNRKGTIHTKETKEKMSKIRKGRVSNRKGVKLSDETKNKISETLKTRKTLTDKTIYYSVYNIYIMFFIFFIRVTN